MQQTVSNRGNTTGTLASLPIDHIDQLLRDALRRVESCDCERGCVECVCSHQCKESNEVMSKAGCEVVLKSLLNMKINVEELPMGPEEYSLPTG